MAAIIPLSHQVVKVPGQRVYAVTDWNANHHVTSNINISPYNFTTTGNLNAGKTTITAVNITPQFYVKYDATKYLSIEVTDVGVVVFDTGGPSIAINKTIGVAGDIGGIGDTTRTGTLTNTGNAIVNGELFINTATNDEWHTGNQVLYGTRYQAGTGSPLLKLQKARGSLASPDYPVSGDYLGRIQGCGWQAGVFTASAAIYMVADENWSGVTNAAGMEFYTTPSAGALTLRGKIDKDGNWKLGDGGTTNYNNISALGYQTMFGQARVERHEIIGAASLHKGAIEPGSGWIGLYPTLDFANGRDDAAHYVVHVPYRRDATTNMTVKIRWMHDTGADVGTVLWKCTYLSSGCGDDPTGAGTEISVLTAGNHAADEIICSTMTTDILAANLTVMDDLALKIWRNDSAGGDTLAEDARLISIHVHFIQNKIGQPT